MPQQLTPAQFVAKWKPVELSERAASQEHFIDLCRLLGQPTPAEHDATGTEYTFEKGVTPTAGASRGSAGERGLADVWWRGKFGWEYKRRGKYRDLAEAYRQLCQYREALENPPLLIVSDIALTEIHTNFTGTVKHVHAIALADLAEPRSLELLRRVFSDPASFKPDVTAERVTREVAERIGQLAQALRSRGHDPHDSAHFLMKCMFCLFAEDVALLPGNLFTKVLNGYRKEPAKLTDRLTELFDKMRTGGDFGADSVAYFNGGLFDEAPALRLTAADIDVLLTAAGRDWGAVEPAIFGTLFERSLDPDTRAQIGAHYTSRDDIMLVVEPVVMVPLRREWEAVKADVEAQLAKRRSATDKKAKAKADKSIEGKLRGFVERLASIRILDPACGSGNFLYVAIQQLLHLEKEVITYAARSDIAVGLIPQVRPTQLHGIEINPYAAELAQVVIWIGYLQWMRDNGFAAPRDPILEPLQTIECRDAILDLSNPKLPGPACWPEAHFIIGNPPFCGSQDMLEKLGETYTRQFRAAYDLPETSDYCCYWFELGRRIIERGDNDHVRIGLLATQSIRGAGSRAVLARIKTHGEIFAAWSDRDWILDGAQVHVSIICFDDGSEQDRFLDGSRVETINVDLSSGIDVTAALQLREMRNLSSQGPVKVGQFELTYADARDLLGTANPNGRPTCDVMRPYITGAEIADRSQGEWIIDFHGNTMGEASGFEGPFERIRKLVKPEREGNRDRRRRERWWLHGASGSSLRRAISELPCYIVCCRHTKDWIFRFVDSRTFPDSGTVAFASDDLCFLGYLQSSIHELWARAQISQVREAESGFRYTSRFCFERFPLPWPPGKEPAKHPANRRIAEAAKELNEQRERWLNPPERVEPIARAVDAEDDFADVPEEARALIRHSAIMARAAKDPKLKKRTLTNLYNERPTWLRLAHEQLDRAVLAAYSATDPDGEWSEDWARVWVDTGAGQPLPDNHELADLRKETDQRVLANLLRINLARAVDRVAEG
jgi:hypothetical protein